jgi:hypothetical protein
MPERNEAAPRYDAHAAMIRQHDECHRSPQEASRISGEGGMRRDEYLSASENGWLDDPPCTR